MGTIYILPKYRRKGYAYKVAKSLKDAHSNMVWFCHEDNIPSRNLAEKIGLKVDRGTHFNNGNIIYKNGH